MKRSPFLISHFSFLICIAMLLSGCIDEYVADVPSEDSDLLVVEGAICSSQLNKFILSRSQPVNAAYHPRMVTDAKVSVRGSDGSEYVTQAADGYYTCSIDTLYPDVSYYLHIETDGEVYESDPQKPIPTEKIAELDVIQETPESNIDILVTPDAPFNPDKVNYYSWTYDETWEVYPDYTTVIYFDTKKLAPVYDPHQFPERGWKDATGSTILVGTSMSYEGQHIRKVKLYDISRNDERMYHKYSGLVHQRAITKAEYEYELARRQASSEMGGLFTPLPSALPTNIHCLTSNKRVIGFVGCSLSVGEYRFFLKPQDFSIEFPQNKDTRRWLDDPSMDDCVKMVEMGMYLCEWIDALRSPDGIFQTAWAWAYQLDVRVRGAYVEKPDFWED